MPGSLTKYAYINAKLRTRISKILPDQFFESISRAHSIAEAIQFFRNTEFSYIETVYNKTGDLKMVERELFIHEINLYLEIEKFMTNKEVLAFTRVLTTRYEVDNVKNLLRLWFDKNVRNRDIQDFLLYMYKKRLHFDLHFDDVLAAQNLKQIASILSQTPYADIILKRADDVDEKKSLFFIEIELDHYYYKNLIAAINKLHRLDREISRRLIGVDIDMQNINLIIRFKLMYNLSLKETLAYIFPFGYSLDIGELTRFYETQDVSGIVQGLIKKRYTGLKALLSSQGSESNSRLILIERVLDQIMMHEVHKVLLSYPFTIGILLVYFILKRNEIRKVITLLNAKYYDIPGDRIMGRV